RLRPFEVLLVERIIQPVAFPDTLAHLGRDIRVGGQLAERVTRCKEQDRIDDHADGDQRDDRDDPATNKVSAHVRLLRRWKTLEQAHTVKRQRHSIPRNPCGAYGTAQPEGYSADANTTAHARRMRR